MTLHAVHLAQLQKRRRQATAYRQKELGYNRKDTRLLLTTDDLADALREVLCWTQICVDRAVSAIPSLRLRMQCSHRQLVRQHADQRVACCSTG